MKSFQDYRDAVRTQAAELLKANPGGFVKIISIDNATKGSVAGIISEVRCFDAARHIIDGTAVLNMPEPEPEPEVVPPALEVQ